MHVGAPINWTREAETLGPTYLTAKVQKGLIEKLVKFRGQKKPSA